MRDRWFSFQAQGRSREETVTAGALAGIFLLHLVFR